MLNELNNMTCELWLNLTSSHSRAGHLICCYPMDRKEEAISVFNNLAGPKADPTKDKFGKAMRDRHESFFHKSWIPLS